MDVLLILFLSAAARALPMEEPYWVPSPARVTLAEVQKRPERYIGQEVQLVLQVKHQQADWEGYTTRFQPSGFLSLTVWADEQLLWVESEYRSDFRRLFVARRSPWSRALTRLQSHQRILVNCVVREHLKGQPWIEVTRIVRLGQHTPEGTILHAIRAAKCIERNALRLAQGELERALAAPLPSHQEGILKRVLWDCRGIQERLAHGWRPTADELTKRRETLLKTLHQVEVLEYYSRPVPGPSEKLDSP